MLVYQRVTYKNMSFLWSLILDDSVTFWSDHMVLRDLGTNRNHAARRKKNIMDAPH